MLRMQVTRQGHTKDLSQNHRIPDGLMLEGNSGGHLVQASCSNRAT